MLNKFLIVVLSLFTTIGFSGIVNIDNEAELVNFINENIPTLRDEYYKEFGQVWDVNSYVDYYDLYDEHDELKAFLIKFDHGYLTVGVDLNIYDVKTEGSLPFYVVGDKNYLIGNHYYIKDNERFIPNSFGAPYLDQIDGQRWFYDNIYIQLTSTNTNALTNFKITYSIADDLIMDNGNYGSYQIYTRTQGAYMDCGAQAAVNILYTFEFSGESGLAKSMNSNNERDTMRSLMNWTTAGRDYLGITFYGIWPGEIVSGLHAYLPDDYLINSEGLFGPSYNGPAIGLYYSLDVVETAHYAMIIGSAQSDAWWIFKTNYDIISHWIENYYHNSGFIGAKKSGTPSYYFVQTQYRQGTYNIQKSTGAKWWEIWKPLYENLEV